MHCMSSYHLGEWSNCYSFEFLNRQRHLKWWWGERRQASEKRERSFSNHCFKRFPSFIHHFVKWLKRIRKWTEEPKYILLLCAHTRKNPCTNLWKYKIKASHFHERQALNSQVCAREKQKRIRTSSSAIEWLFVLCDSIYLERMKKKRSREEGERERRDRDMLELTS